MAGKIADLVVKVGEYTDQQGMTKGRYENVGTVLMTNDGSELMLLKRTFNPAGVPNPEDRDTVILNRFERSQEPQQPRQAPRPQAPRPQRQAAYNATYGAPDGGIGGMDDNIPF